MGLAEPRKRIKIAHDPRNTSWTNSANSYGQRLMKQQGWQSGEALGARGSGSKYSDAEAAKVNVKYKDDMLGLGATLKSKDIANQRTGFDAFQGLLGRLNAKSEEEVHAVEKKLEDKKLAMFAQGRWGGMIFVPGGVLVQSDPYKQVEALKKRREEEARQREETGPKSKVETSAEAIEAAKRKAEKKLKKEEKRLKKEARRLRKEAEAKEDSEEQALPTPDSSSATDEAPEVRSQKKTDAKLQRHSDGVKVIQPLVTKEQPRNGRHLLRGKNIHAKRMAFADMKGLDEIFMKVG